jgi:hypothetical protein
MALVAVIPFLGKGARANGPDPTPFVTPDGPILSSQAARGITFRLLFYGAARG